MNFFLRIFGFFAVSIFVAYVFFMPNTSHAVPCEGTTFPCTPTPSPTAPAPSAPDTPTPAPGTPGTPTPPEVSDVVEDADVNTPLDADTSENRLALLIYDSAVSIAGWLISFSGSFFDTAINYVVLEMGCWFVADRSGCEHVTGGGSVGAVVNALWTVVRDLFNILFIFSLVWIGLRTILSSDDTGTQRALGWLIVAALLINFSLYFTKVIVDIANYSAVAIHAVATTGIVGEYGWEEEGGETLYKTGKHSLSGAYMETLRISSWFAEGPTGAWVQVFVFAIMVMLFAIILAMTLVFGGIMLITRFIAIVIFMIFSPAMFLGWVLPSFKSYGDMWWKKFLGYAFFAPAYIFMLYIGLYTLIQLKNSFKVDEATYGAALTGNWTEGMFVIFFYFAIGIGFLIAATKVGQSMSVAGANVAMNSTQGALRRMKNGATWVPRYGASRFASGAVGAGSKWMGDRMDTKDAAREKPRSRTRRAIRSYVGKGETASFGIAGSRKQRVDGDKTEAQKHTVSIARRKIQSDMSSSDEATRQQAFQNATSEQLIQIAKTDDGRKAIMNNAHLVTPGKLEAIVKSDDVGETETNKIQEAHRKETVKYIKGDAANPGKGFGKASTDELNASGFEVLQQEKNIIHLTTDKIDKLKMVEAHKDILKQEHEKAVLKVIRGGTVDGVTRADILKRKAGDIAKLPKEAFDDASFVQKLPESVVKSKPFSEMDVSKQKNVRKHLEKIISTPPQNISSSDLDRIAEIDGWLRSPGGKSFGK